MVKMTTNEALVEAHRRGWRVDDAGVLRRPDGSAAPFHFDDDGYPRFTVWLADLRVRKSIHVHRLVAYQKFGDAMFVKGIEVRHLDNTPGNSAPSNIEIGTPSENAFDKSRETRVRVAAGARRKLTPEQRVELLADRSAGMKYTDLAAKYGLQKSTISYIVRGMTYSVPGVDV